MIVYAYRRHDLGMMDEVDQVRFAILHVEIDRIRVEQRNVLFEQRQRQQQMNDQLPIVSLTRCPICFDQLSDEVITVAPVCGQWPRGM